jgi:hypothetical protein
LILKYEESVMNAENPTTGVKKIGTKPEPAKTEAELRAELEAELEAKFNERFAALEAKLTAASAPAIVTINNPSAKPNNHWLGFDPNNPLDLPEGETQLVHFVEDGFTVGSSVYYRGQEANLPKNDILSGRDQYRKYGQQYYRVGPWDGEGYNLDDPNLTDEDRARLQAVMAKK